MSKLVKRESPISRHRGDMTPFDEIDSLFDRLWHGGLMRPFDWRLPEWTSLAAGALPRVDIVEEDDAVIVRAELPGVAKDALDVSLTEDRLTIKGETHKAQEAKGEVFRSERYHGSFSRTIALPTAVRGDDAKAAFTDGILEIRLPKAEGSARQTIAVE